MIIAKSKLTSMRCAASVLAWLLLFLPASAVFAQDQPPTVENTEPAVVTDTATATANNSEEGADNGDEEPKPCDLETIRTGFARPGANIEAIQQLLKAGGYLTDRVDSQPGPRTHHALYRLCHYMETSGILRDRGDAELDAIDALRARLADGGSRRETWVELQQQANRVMLEPVDSSAAEPSAGCGCSRDFSATVIGFLPSWLTGGTPYGVDFSVLDRIGFHALQLDQLDSDGHIRYPSLWSKGNPSESHIARFINAAVRHQVRIDLTFYSAEWMTWDESAIERAASAVEHSMSLKFSDISDDDEIGANLLGLLRRLLPYVGSDSNVYADGINLYFDRYRDPGQAGRIVAMVNAVGRRMPEVPINILLDPDWSGLKGALEAGRSVIDKKLFAGLEQIFEDGAEVEVAHLLVFLPRSIAGDADDEKRVSDARKSLRRAIEDAFENNGLTRRTVLRKTVPIIVTFDDHDQPKDYFATGKSRFVDDLIYLQDNFAGVGLWPLPLLAPVGGGDAGGDGSNGESAANGADPPNDGVNIGLNLVDQLEIKADWRRDERWEEIDNLIESVCKSVCPNRWEWRIAFDVLAALLVIYWLLSLWDCRLAQFYERYRLYFVLVVVLAASILALALVCDPFWKERRVMVLSALLVLAIVVLGWPHIKQRMLPKLP